jgi:choline dehydrogenase
VTYVDEKRERVSTEVAYMTEHVLARPNLKVVIHSQVSQILFEKTNSQLRAIGVEFGISWNSPRYRARARRQVVLA